MPLERTTRNAVLVLVGEAGDVTVNMVIRWMSELGYDKRATQSAIGGLALSGFLWSRRGRLRLRPLGQRLYDGHVEEGEE